MFTPKLWFSLWFVPLAPISINHLLAKYPVLKESFIFNSTKQMFIWFHVCHYLFLKMCFRFAEFWKKSFLRSLTLGAMGAQTRFFKMWPKSMHDQKFEKNFRPRPEDGLYGSNEPKKCEIRPVVSSIVHFKVFKSYFIYIIDFCTLFFFQKRTFCYPTQEWYITGWILMYIYCRKKTRRYVTPNVWRIWEVQVRVEVALSLRPIKVLLLAAHIFYGC